MKNSIVTVAPSVEPVSTTEAKAQLRIHADDTTYDTEITRKLAAARQWVERRYGIAIITQTRKQTQDQFPCDGKWSAVKLLYPPVQSITTFSYTDSEGTTQTLVAGTNYSSTGLMTPTVGAQDIVIPELYPISFWPTIKSVPGAVSITYVAGFGNDGTYVPQPVKEAILMVLAHFFEQRQAEITGESIAKFEMDVDRVMSAYEVFDHAGIDD